MAALESDDSRMARELAAMEAADAAAAAAKAASQAGGGVAAAAQPRTPAEKAAAAVAAQAEELARCAQEDEDRHSAEDLQRSFDAEAAAADEATGGARGGDDAE